MKTDRTVNKLSALMLAAVVGLLAGCSIGEGGGEGDDGKDHDSTTSASGVSTGTTTGTTTTVATAYNTTILAWDPYSASAVSAAVVAPHLGLPSATTTLGGIVSYAYNTAIARAQIDIGSTVTTTTTAGGVVYSGGYVPETIDFAPAQGAVLAKTETVNLLRSVTASIPTDPYATPTLTVTPPASNLGAASTHSFSVTNTGVVALAQVEFFFSATGTTTPISYIYDYRGTLFAGGAIGVTVPTFLGGVGGALLTFPFTAGASYDVTAVGKDVNGAIIAYSAPATVAW